MSNKEYILLLLLSIQFIFYGCNFRIHKEILLEKNSDQKIFSLKKVQKAEKHAVETLAKNKSKEESKSHKITIWFVLSRDGQLYLAPAQRDLLIEDQEKLVLEKSIQELLLGPNETEKKEKLGSEIPINSELKGLRVENNSIIINLSNKFVSGGGTNSIDIRLKQLSRTAISAIGQSKDVYLEIDGKKIYLTPGEGIEIKQPINR